MAPFQSKRNLRGAYLRLDHQCK